MTSAIFCQPCGSQRDGEQQIVDDANEQDRRHRHEFNTRRVEAHMAFRPQRGARHHEGDEGVGEDGEVGEVAPRRGERRNAVCWSCRHTRANIAASGRMRRSARRRWPRSAPGVIRPRARLPRSARPGGGSSGLPRIMSESFSAIMMVGALVLPPIERRHHGRIDHAQAIDAAHAQLFVHRRLGINAHAHRADRVINRLRRSARIHASISLSVRMCAPGAISSPR